MKFKYLCNKIETMLLIRLQQIRRGGYPVILRKARLICCLPFAILLVLIIRIFHFLILIRFVLIDVERIGHSYFIDVYLNEKFQKKKQFNKLDVFYFTSDTCNPQLKKIWARALFAPPFPTLIPLVDRLNHLMPGFQKHIVPVYIGKEFREHCSGYPPNVFFTKKEEEFGKRALRKLGIADNAEFICIHVRDPAYLGTLGHCRDYSYHDYRDCSINNYRLAAEELANRGYFVMRMGAVVKDSFSSENPKIIDYAKKYRTDFLDVYLSGKCRFFVGCGSGIDEIPKLFRLPVLYINFAPFNMCGLNAAHLFIPKKFWLKKEKRFLKFRELLNFGPVGGFFHSSEYEKLGIESVENTQEEIVDAVVEMEERLNGTWRTDKEDERLQLDFLALFKNNEFYSRIATRIGAKFLSQNKELLY